MTDVLLHPPIWIDQPAGLQRMVADLSQHPQLAVDTESNSLFVYQEQVCLIQFSTGETDYLVDPLALSDLSVLGPIFENPAIEKIFHAAEYDVICLKRDFGFVFNHIFDTMLAARILGRTAVGLGSMLQEVFGLDVDKRFQRANWGQRPLTQPLLDYARQDTHYLIPIRDRLLAELKASGRLGLAEEDFRRMTAVASLSNENGTNSCFRVPGSRDLSTVQMAVLFALCEYRDDQARRANLPAFKILGNQLLLNLALHQPRNRSELANVDGMNPRLMKRYSEGLLAAIQRGRSSGPVTRPPGQARPSDEYLARLDTLRNWRKQTGLQIGVPSDVILPRETLETIAQARLRSIEDLKHLMGDLPWRLEKFGPEILRVLNIA